MSELYSFVKIRTSLTDIVLFYYKLIFLSMVKLLTLIPTIFFSASAFYIPGLISKSYTLNESLDVQIGSVLTSHGKKRITSFGNNSGKVTV